MGRKSARIMFVCLAAASALLVWGCTSREAQPQFIYGLAEVASIEVSMDRDSPSRANAVVRGVVRDSCTRIDSVRQSLEGQAFVLTLTTRRPISADGCRDVEVPFEATVPLVVRGLRPGAYTVRSGNVSATLYLRQLETMPEV